MRHPDADRSARWRPQGLSIWILNVGFGLAAAWGVLAAVLLTRLHAEQTQLALVLTTSLHTAVAESYASETTQGSTVAINPTTFFANFQTAVQTALTVQEPQGQFVASLTACAPLPQSSALCSASGFGVTAPPALSQTGVIDVGNLSLSSTQVSAQAESLPPPFLGIQVPITATVSQVLTRNQAVTITN